MRLLAALAVVLVCSSALAVMFMCPAALAASPSPRVRILVLKEHGVGSPALAQPYLDRFVALAAEKNAWKDAKGQYFTSRSAAETFIAAEKPHYAILSLAPFLAFRNKYHLEVIGQVSVSLIGGRQYYLIARNDAGFVGCKTRTLASDHLDDVRFIERVVAGGEFKLADFTVRQTKRPLQTVKHVLSGEAACALIDDAQLAELSHLPEADRVRPIWTSRELPPMVVVAFPAAPAADRKRLRETMTTLCDDEAKTVCAEVGIDSLKTAGASDYATVIAAYGR